MFDDNAGTQFVADCLEGLAFHHVKSTMHWTSQDLNKILATGNKFYTFPQRSYLMHSTRYLLEDGLPKFF